MKMIRTVKIDYRHFFGITALDLEYDGEKLVAVRGASGSTGDQPKSENLEDLLMFARYVGSDKTILEEIDDIGKAKMEEEDAVEVVDSDLQEALKAEAEGWER